MGALPPCLNGVLPCDWLIKCVPVKVPGVYMTEPKVPSVWGCDCFWPCCGGQRSQLSEQCEAEKKSSVRSEARLPAAVSSATSAQRGGWGRRPRSLGGASFSAHTSGASAAPRPPPGRPPPGRPPRLSCEGVDAELSFTLLRLLRLHSSQHHQGQKIKQETQTTSKLPK